MYDEDSNAIGRPSDVDKCTIHSRPVDDNINTRYVTLRYVTLRYVDDGSDEGRVLWAEILLNLSE